MSFSCSATCLRRRVSSSRSAGVNGVWPWAVAASMRRRSSATQEPSRLSFRPSSRATEAMVRPESITRWAASTLYSVVYDRRERDMVNILPARPLVPLSRCPLFGGNPRSAAQLTRQVVAARALWVLAVLAFVATAASAAFTSEFSLPLLLILVAAITATVALVTVTRQPAKSVTREPARSAAARRDAQ